MFSKPPNDGSSQSSYTSSSHHIVHWRSVGHLAPSDGHCRSSNSLPSRSCLSTRSRVEKSPPNRSLRFQGDGENNQWTPPSGQRGSAETPYFRGGRPRIGAHVCVPFARRAKC